MVLTKLQRIKNNNEYNILNKIFLNRKKLMYFKIYDIYIYIYIYLERRFMLFVSLQHIKKEMSSTYICCNSTKVTHFFIHWI